MNEENKFEMKYNSAIIDANNKVLEEKKEKTNEKISPPPEINETFGLRHRNVQSNETNNNKETIIDEPIVEEPIINEPVINEPIINNIQEENIHNIEENYQEHHTSTIDSVLTFFIRILYVIIALILCKKLSRRFL